ncbi:MAG: hypothetical protein HRU43_07335 [Simkaniaceae bacterium]|nr:hypothetical protein [Simkaniaceae bacterium]
MTLNNFSKFIYLSPLVYFLVLLGPSLSLASTNDLRGNPDELYSQSVAGSLFIWPDLDSDLPFTEQDVYEFVTDSTAFEEALSPAGTVVPENYVEDGISEYFCTPLIGVGFHFASLRAIKTDLEDSWQTLANALQGSFEPLLEYLDLANKQSWNLNDFAKMSAFTVKFLALNPNLPTDQAHDHSVFIRGHLTEETFFPITNGRKIFLPSAPQVTAARETWTTLLSYLGDDSHNYLPQTHPAYSFERLHDVFNFIREAIGSFH